MARLMRLDKCARIEAIAQVSLSVARVAGQLGRHRSTVQWELGPKRRLVGVPDCLRGCRGLRSGEAVQGSQAGGRSQADGRGQERLKRR